MALDQFKEKIANEGNGLQKEVREKTTGYILAAFGFVAGLAWNDAIKAFIEEFFPVDKGNLTAKFVYALGVTIVLVIVTIYLARIIREK